MAVKTNDLAPRHRAPQYCSREAPRGMHPRRIQASGTYEGFGAFNESVSENTFTDDGPAIAPDQNFERHMERYYRTAMAENWHPRGAARFECSPERSDARSVQIDDYIKVAIILAAGILVGRGTFYFVGIMSGAY